MQQVIAYFQQMDVNYVLSVSTYHIIISIFPEKPRAHFPELHDQMVFTGVQVDSSEQTAQGDCER